MTAKTVTPTLLPDQLQRPPRKNGQFREAWLRLKKRPAAMIALAGILFLILVAIFADVIADYDTRVVMQNVQQKLQGPSWEHPFGTDSFGRDIFGRLVHGTRVALILGFGATSISCVIGLVLACLCAFFGGVVDLIVMRFIDILSAIPSLVLAIAICAGLGNGLPQLIIAISAGKIATFTRMLRSKALTIANMEYMEAGRCLGASTPGLMIRYMLPNIINIVIIEFSASVAGNILMGATLTFIGLGVSPPTPEWGLMLSDGLDYFQFYPRLVVAPGIVLVFTALCITTFGDCLRDAFDPQLKGKA